MDDELLDRDQLAVMLNMSRKFIVKHTTSRRIPGMAKIGRMWRYRKSDILKALNKGQLLFSQPDLNPYRKEKGMNTFRKQIEALLSVKDGGKEDVALNADEIASQLSAGKKKTISALHNMKKAGVIKAIGKKPYHYVLNTDTIPIPVPANKAVKKEEETVEEYIIVYLEEKAAHPEIYSVGRQDLVERFMAMQKDKNIKEIAAYKKLKCDVVLYPMLRYKSASLK